ncbi:MAG: sodium:calcium antiporter [Filifactoraceae bacterium]
MILTVILYLCMATIVVLLSNKLAYYVDLLDRNSNISGAFLGGVLLAAVTSLPELFTSLSSTIFLEDSDLVLGNILGSNIFNMAVLGTLILFSFKKFCDSQLSLSHKYTAIFVTLVYIIIASYILIGFNTEILTIEFLSFIIAGVYIYSVKTMSSDDTGSEDMEHNEKPIDIKKIIIKFTLLSLALVVASIIITFLTNTLAIKLNLGMTFAGALLLGVATSLPELSSSIALVKMGNFNATSGNILGSNLFNFFILVIADISFLSGSLYTMSPEAKSLMFFGLISSIMLTATFILKTTGQVSPKNRRRIIFLLSGVITVFSYLTFIALSVG